MYALEDVDLFNILMIPRAADLSDTEMTAVISEGISYCEDRRAFMIIDIPKTVDTVQDAKDWIDANGGFRHRSTATYFPRLLMPDPKNEYRLRSVGAGGTMAGVYAKTDSTRGVWKAPAGLDARLRGVSRLDYLLTDPENGSLNPIAINCMRTFPIPGSVAWGARTLDGSDAAASEWKYIPVRRLALMLEESLFRGTKWVVFEPNDEPTWAKVRQNIRAFMMSLFRQGAFQGDSPDKAFYVKCDGETTTADDRNRGIVNIEVGFAPLKPAEFVVIKIQQIPDVE
jgi:phage tail sheath protein FI